MTDTREHPALFNGEMVRATLDKLKTQMRRELKPQPCPEFLARGVVRVVPQWPNQDGVRWFMADGLSELRRCPYGAPGDRLWVRETFRVCDVAGESFSPADIAPTNAHCFYRADCEPGGAGPWRPSIHMPRWASRLLLEVTDVRVERVQEISEADVAAEGIIRIERSARTDGLIDGYGLSETPKDQIQTTRRYAFWALWDSIYAKSGFGWDANPWVWATTFKVIKQ